MRLHRERTKGYLLAMIPIAVLVFLMLFGMVGYHIGTYGRDYYFDFYYIAYHSSLVLILLFFISLMVCIRIPEEDG